MTHVGQPAKVSQLAEDGQPATFLKMIAGHERLYPSIISPARLGKYV